MNKFDSNRNTLIMTNYTKLTTHKDKASHAYT